MTECYKVKGELGVLEAEARIIYQEGRFIEECRALFQTQWYGDAYILDFVLLMGAALRVSNAMEGIHLNVRGDTQTGKSAGAKMAMKFLSRADISVQTFSPMAIYYSEDVLHEKMVVLSDDTTLSKEVIEVYKVILTSWKDGCTRRTVANHKGADLKIPKRVSFIMTNIDGVAQESDEGQADSRFLTLEVRHTADEMAVIWEFMKTVAPIDMERLTMLQCVWECMPYDTFIDTSHVNIPYKNTVRESTRYVTMLQAHALLCARDHVNAEDIDAIDKLLTYSKKMVNSKTAPWTRNEEALRSALTQEFETGAAICKRTGMTRDMLHRACRGQRGSYDNPTGGLIAKEPRFETKLVSSPEETNLRMYRIRQ